MERSFVEKNKSGDGHKQTAYRCDLQKADSDPQSRSALFVSNVMAFAHRFRSGSEEATSSFDVIIRARNAYGEYLLSLFSHKKGRAYLVYTALTIYETLG